LVYFCFFHFCLLIYVSRFSLFGLDGTGVTDAFRMYLRPLLGSALPEPHRLRLNPVEKVLR